MDHKEFASLGGKTHKKDPNYFKELVRKRKWRPVGGGNTDNIKKLQDLGYSQEDIDRILKLSRQRIHQIITGYKSFATSGFSLIKIFGNKKDVCNNCGAPAKVTHHIDKNSTNNSSNNLVRLCTKCHGLRHRNSL